MLYNESIVEKLEQEIYTYWHTYTSI